LPERDGFNEKTPNRLYSEKKFGENNIYESFLGKNWQKKHNIKSNPSLN
jgi:hypothetical protein